MKKILVIEDNNEMNEMICKFLGSEYETISAFSGTEGLLIFKMQKVDLVILDRMLPGKTGEEVLEEIRLTSNVPVIILTAVSSKEDIASFLLKGADDYMTKPFDINELKARIFVRLRNNKIETEPEEDKIISYKAITLNADEFKVSSSIDELMLKRKEFEILQLLIENPKKIYTKELLYEVVWGEPYYGDENTINVHVSNLRKKLKIVDPNNDYIDTVWGIGIKLA